MSFDWDAILSDQDADDEEFKAFPSGEYTVQVVAAKVENSAAGNEYIKIQVKLTEGPFANRVLFSNLNFVTTSSASMKYTLRDLKALGVTSEWLKATKAKLPQIAAAIGNVTVIANVTDDEVYNDKKQNKIRSFKALPSATSVVTPSPWDDEPPF